MIKQQGLKQVEKIFDRIYENMAKLNFQNTKEQSIYEKSEQSALKESINQEKQQLNLYLTAQTKFEETKKGVQNTWNDENKIQLLQKLVIRLKQELAHRNKQIEQLNRSNHKSTPVLSTDKLEEQRRFLIENNKQLYKASMKINSELNQAKSKIEVIQKQLADKQQHINLILNEVSQLKALNKQLIRQKAKLITNSQFQIKIMEAIKHKFTQQNSWLRSKIKQISQEKNHLRQQKLLSQANQILQKQSYKNYYQVLKDEVVKIKQDVNAIDFRKKSLNKPSKSIHSQRIP